MCCGRERASRPGERTRAELALQAARAAGCLVLDEPTNHLDLPAVEELERALSVYDGTLILVTHDRRFLEQVGVTRVFDLSSAAPARDRPTARPRLETDTEPQQVHRHAVALPAMARLHGRLDAAEARGVLDQACRSLDSPRVSSTSNESRPPKRDSAPSRPLNVHRAGARAPGRSPSGAARGPLAS